VRLFENIVNLKSKNNMRKITILAMLLAIAAASFGQQITPKQDWKETEYYKKSRNQKTAAWILLGGGAALFLGGAIYDANYRASHPDDMLTGVNAGTIIGTIGLVSALGSVPLFFASHKNVKKAKATSVSIEMERTQGLPGTVFISRSFPALGVRISL
jgi:hypothetical protein